MATMNLNTPNVFQCPGCGEFINTSMDNCKFCGAPVDAVASAQAAEVQANVASACSDASYLKICARVLAISYPVSFTPIIGGIAGWAFLILLVVTPILFVRWWTKFSKLATKDPDYAKARSSTWVSGGIWVAMVVVWLVVSVVIGILTASLR